MFGIRMLDFRSVNERVTRSEEGEKEREEDGETNGIGQRSPNGAGGELCAIVSIRSILSIFLRQRKP